jgi:hypothetical protein
MTALERMLFSAGARDPRTAARLHRYSERSIPPRTLLAPRALGRAAWMSATAARGG